MQEYVGCMTEKHTLRSSPSEQVAQLSHVTYNRYPINGLKEQDPNLHELRGTHQLELT